MCILLGLASFTQSDDLKSQHVGAGSIVHVFSLLYRFLLDVLKKISYNETRTGDVKKKNRNKKELLQFENMVVKSKKNKEEEIQGQKIKMRKFPRK